LEIILIS
jgi:charged multivesicular body protein 1